MANHKAAAKAEIRRGKMRALMKLGLRVTDIASRYRISDARVHQILWPNGKARTK